MVKLKLKTSSCTLNLFRIIYQLSVNLFQLKFPYCNTKLKCHLSYHKHFVVEVQLDFSKLKGAAFGLWLNKIEKLFRLDIFIKCIKIELFLYFEKAKFLKL